MVGRKTREQQKRIINRQENPETASEASLEEDLTGSDNARKAREKGRTLTAPQEDLVDPDDRNILRGRNQESRKTTSN